MMKYPVLPLIKRSARLFATGLLACSVVLVSCNNDDDDGGPMTPDPDPDPDPVAVIKEVPAGIIRGDVTWSSDTIYRLTGFVRVGDPANPANSGILRIEPGTVIVGDFETKGTLVVQRGSQIFAEGTAQDPIVFTSERRPGDRTPGDWGGVVICGNARNNSTQASGNPVQLEGNYDALHGGQNDTDNSGVMRYCRIEFAGIPINPNEEVNSLTMGSVGSGTVIEYITCSYGLDDAFEWFGGTVNGRYLIAYRGLDDDFDVDLGHQGNIQFGIGIRDRALADQSGSNGFEVDNQSQDIPNPVQPFTQPTFSNMTIIGPKKNREAPISLQFQHAAQLRRGTKIRIHNSFFTGYTWGIFIDGTPAATHATNDELRVRHSIVAAVDNWGGNGFGSAGDLFPNPPANGNQHPNNPRGVAFRTNTDFDTEAWFRTPAFGNRFLNTWQEAGISPTVFDPGTPTVTVTQGALTTGASFDGLPDFFQRVNYVGAFGAEDWTAGWNNWNGALLEEYIPE